MGKGSRRDKEEEGKLGLAVSLHLCIWPGASLSSDITEQAFVAFVTHLLVPEHSILSPLARRSLHGSPRETKTQLGPGWEFRPQ